MRAVKMMEKNANEDTFTIPSEIIEHDMLMISQTDVAYSIYIIAVENASNPTIICCFMVLILLVF